MRFQPVPDDIGRDGVDLIVVGAGINGAGIARDAALRGLRVVLLDKGDIASGTTSWSTRLIHGGLRYLEHREVGLVRESLRERERLLRSAPHLVRPVPLLLPLYRGDTRGRWLVRAGMLAYDALSFDKSLPRHRMLSHDEALRRAPGLAADGLVGAALYYDAQVEYAERLAVENALSARDHGAMVLTYARVDRLIVDDEQVRGVEFTDLIDGAVSEVRASVTLNVAGPWVDQVLAGVGATPRDRMIGGTKGSHIIVGQFPGAPADALYVEARQDGRPYFIAPWNGLYLIGTTDTRYEGDLDRVEATDAEVEYLVRETNRVIPGAGLTAASVLYTYAGVRPLPEQPGGAAAAITRRHLVYDHAGVGTGGMISIVGGKLTTYRNLAEEAVDAVYRKLGRPTPVATTRSPLPGAEPVDGRDLAGVRSWLSSEGFATATVDHLMRVYGTRALRVAALAHASADLCERLDPRSGEIGAEVVFAFRDEHAETLTDVLMRRTMVGLGAQAGVGADERAADIGRRHLGWNQDRARREVAAYRDYIGRFHPRALLASAQHPSP